MAGAVNKSEAKLPIRQAHLDRHGSYEWTPRTQLYFAIDNVHPPWTVRG
jgi:hypothetical protein